MTTDRTAAAEIVDRMRDAYNARDLDAFCALFAPDAEITDLRDGRLIARGLADIREGYARRFAASPTLFCEIKERISRGTHVVDYETVTGIDADPWEVIALYDVRDGTIRTLQILRIEDVGG